MAAIIGTNGAGKTTLFESLEWCLYGTSTGRNKDINNRFHPGRPRVVVTLEDPRSGIHFEIERELKGGSAQAAIYSSENPGAPVVQGPREVTQFVASKLTGLSARAFVSTFFTRQKELSFFGDVRPTERRREIGKLLGLETIRIAQERIADRRRTQHAIAEAKEQQRTSNLVGIDLPAQRIRLEEGSTRANASLGYAERQLARAKSVLGEARANLTSVRELEREFREYQNRLATLDGELSTANSRIEAITGQLQEIERAEKEIDRLQPDAAALSERRQRVATLENQRSISREISEKSRFLERLELSLGQSQSYLNDLVRSTETEFASNWRSAEATQENLIADIDRLTTIIDSFDMQTHQHSLRLMSSAITHANQRDQVQNELKDLEDHHQKLSDELNSLLLSGDPRTRENEIESARKNLTTDAAIERARAASITTERSRLTSIVQALDTNELDEQCPTCGRGFTDQERAQTSATLRLRIDELAVLIGEHEKRATSLENQVALATSELDQARQLSSRIADLEIRLSNGNERIAAQRLATEEANTALDEVMRSLQRDEIPTQEKLAANEEHLQALTRIVQQRPALVNLRIQVEQAFEERETTRSQLEALGPDQYNPDVHRHAQTALEKATNAASAIDAYTSHIKRKPELERQLAETNVSTSALRASRETTHVIQQNLGFSGEMIETAELEEQRALQAHDGSRTEQQNASVAAADANRQLEDLSRFEETMERLATEAIAARRKADDLERMYAEFNRFERFVATTVTPLLEEIASDLLADITEGRYDRMTFTEDFGIKVYDGDQGPFDIAQFSGGERDAISLCARLSLSQLIGGQAIHPIQFLVLDEVFGALDERRRANVLQMLQRLVQENPAFRQLFLISHVGDIKETGTLDEVWQVAETGQGQSNLQLLGGRLAETELHNA